MVERFDDVLKAVLAPPDRPPDRRFVLRVQAAIMLEERLAARRSSLVRELAKQLVALAAVAAGLWWIGRAPPVASLFAESPAVALTAVLAGFGLLVAILGRRPDAGARPPVLRKLNGS
jgi:hypothetical protein